MQAGQRLDRLDKIHLPGLISGGEEPEDGDKARAAAPGKVQSLDRLVSLADFESETLAIPGVSRVAARWGLVDNVPAVVLTVLMDTGRAAEIEGVRQIVANYNRWRGPQRFPVIVLQGQRLYTGIAAQVAFDPAYREELVRADIATALGLPGEDGALPRRGLFAPMQRQFGQAEYATRITGVIQNVPGVQWTRVTGLVALGEAGDPADLVLPAVVPTSATLACDGQHILSLYVEHLRISAVSAPSSEGG